MTRRPQVGDPPRRLLTTLAALAIVVHLLALYLPGSPEPTFDVSGADKAVHVLLFAVPVWLLGRLTGRIWLVAGVFAGHAVVSELVQLWFVPYRSGDPLDLLADLVGIGAAVALLTRRERAGRPATRPDPPDSPGS